MLVPLLVDKNENTVAILSGALAWALVMWPIAWRPSLMLPFENRGWIVALILLWWIPFAGLPAAGVATTKFIESATSDERAGTATGQLTLAVVTVVGLGVFGWALSRVASRRIRFRDDPGPEYVEDWTAHHEIPAEEQAPSPTQSLIFLSGALSIAVVYLLLRRRD